MADGQTPNYGLTKPQVGADSDTWGDKLNANMDAIDAALHAVAESVPDTSTLMPKAGGNFTAAPTVGGGGAVPHFAAAGLTDATIYIGPASGADPRGANPAPGSIWFQT